MAFFDSQGGINCKVKQYNVPLFQGFSFIFLFISGMNTNENCVGVWGEQQTKEAVSKITGCLGLLRCSFLF